METVNRFILKDVVLRTAEEEIVNTIIDLLFYPMRLVMLIIHHLVIVGILVQLIK